MVECSFKNKVVLDSSPIIKVFCFFFIVTRFLHTAASSFLHDFFYESPEDKREWMSKQCQKLRSKVKESFVKLVNVLSKSISISIYLSIYLSIHIYIYIYILIICTYIYIYKITIHIYNKYIYIYIIKIASHAIVLTLYMS